MVSWDEDTQLAVVADTGADLGDIVADLVDNGADLVDTGAELEDTVACIHHLDSLANMPVSVADGMLGRADAASRRENVGSKFQFHLITVGSVSVDFSFLGEYPLSLAPAFLWHFFLHQNLASTHQPKTTCIPLV